MDAAPLAPGRRQAAPPAQQVRARRGRKARAQWLRSERSINHCGERKKELSSRRRKPVHCSDRFFARARTTWQLREPASGLGASGFIHSAATTSNRLQQLSRRFLAPQRALSVVRSDRLDADRIGSDRIALGQLCLLWQRVANSLGRALCRALCSFACALQSPPRRCARLGGGGCNCDLESLSRCCSSLRRFI